MTTHALLGFFERVRPWADERESPSLPSRPALERRLLGNGLECAVRRLTPWEDRGLRLLSFGFARVATAAAIWLTLYSAFNAALTQSSERFPSFFMFDVLTAVTVAFVPVVWKIQHDVAAGSARDFMPQAALAIALLAAFPYVVFTAADADQELTELFSGVLPGDLGAQTQSASLLAGEPSPGTQNFWIHLAITAGLALLLYYESKVRFIERNVRLAGSAVRASARTARGVVRSLPVVLATVFLAAFVEELWIIIGDLEVGELVLLLVLPFLCVNAAIKSIAREEAEQATERSARLRRQEDHQDDADVAGLAAAGFQPKPFKHPELQSALTRQWRMHIFLRVIAASVAIALLALVVSGLTMSEDVLRGWLADNPANWTPPEAWTPSIGIAELYFSAQAVPVALFVGAFASLVFVGSALSEGDSRDRLLAPERQRMGVLLALASMYQQAVDGHAWRRPGVTEWRNYWMFLARDPDRRLVKPLSFGTSWRQAAERRFQRWSVEWNRQTGELYTYRSKPVGRVELLAICRDQEQVEEQLEGWEQQQAAPDSLAWIRERVRGFGDPLPA